ncbi:hypothetical protein [Nocardia altamirensis]|uniref:hypothetical protein n=1 Tax=Nocardia altamirensis TaxID=472158 RepID=UPI0008407068|nr:hypothetical protein [Nocardia altamirensis]
MDKASVVAAVLGYPNAAVMNAQEGPARAYRLAYVLDIPVHGAEGLLVLDRVLGLFLAEDDVPASDDVQGLNDQTHRIAASGVPVDEKYCRVVAEAFGYGAETDLGEAVYQVNSRAARFLSKSVIVARGDTDRLFEEPVDESGSLIDQVDMQRLVAIEVAKGIPIEAVLATINDMHHYDFTFPDDTYIDGVTQTCAGLREQGHVLVAVGMADLADDPSGAGLNVSWSVPDGGRGMEVRFRVRGDARAGRAAQELRDGWRPAPTPTAGTRVHVDSHLFVLRGHANLRGGCTVLRGAYTHLAFGDAVLLDVAEHPGYFHNWNVLAAEQDRLAQQFGIQPAHADPEDARAVR